MPSFILLVLAGLGAGVVWWDLRTHTIPNGLLLAGAIVLVGLQYLTGYGWEALLGGLVTCIFGLLLWRFTHGFGGGDMKYWTVLGVALGAAGALWTLALAAAGALVWGLVSGDWHRRGRKAAIALGPWLAAASVMLAVMRMVIYK